MIFIANRYSFLRMMLYLAERFIAPSEKLWLGSTWLGRVRQGSRIERSSPKHTNVAAEAT
jgi:hypothetical protein